MGAEHAAMYVLQSRVRKRRPIQPPLFRMSARHYDGRSWKLRRSAAPQMSRPGPYPTKRQIRRVVETARDLGVKVAGFRVGADGSIVVFEATDAPRDEFEQWAQAKSRT